MSWFPLEVLEARDETPSLRALILDGRDAAGHHVQPGQVVKVQNDKGEGYFALANAPGEGRFELLVRRGGSVGDQLISQAQPGAQVQASAPFGRGFPVAEGNGRDLLLFAAGSGISPVRSLVQHVTRMRDGFGRVVLFYGERRESDFAYAAERDQWTTSGVQVVLCCSQPSSTWVGPKGYVQDVARSISFAAVDAGGAVAYLCGMKGMVSAVRDALSAAGLPVERTYLNY